MSSFGVYTSQARRSAAVIAVIFATAAIALLPALVSAAQVTERSIALSSSSKGTDGVEYTINFTPDGDAGAFVVDFCTNSPIVGQPCTAPTGFSTANAASTKSGFTDVTHPTTSEVVVAGTMTGGTAVSVPVTGIKNPDAAGVVYARIVTYDTKENATAYASENLGTGATDQGGVAISITDTVGVQGAVLESMTFCVAGAAITTPSCGGTLQAPKLQLGETTGTTKALSAQAVSTGDIYTQISTNAATGAVVNLKNSASCGGMKRAEAATCDIAPALKTGVALGEAKFGVLVNPDTATDGTMTTTGTYEAYPTSGYNDTTYALNWAADGLSGVSSPYGDPILDTNSLPVNNRNMKLTFGASISNNTPAGLYSADLSLIATGKF